MNLRKLLIALASILAIFFVYNIVKEKDGSSVTGEKPILVVIPSYNNKEWYKKNLDSVLTQNYKNYRVVYLDDASTDGTGQLVKDYINEKNAKGRVTLVQNPARVGALENLYNTISKAKKDEIVITLDGDDWLYNDDVLAYINNAYADPNVWMTYGQFIMYPSNEVGFTAQIPQEVIDNNSVRTSRSAISHLRTFYAGLFQKINKEDLLYNGQFFPTAWDVAMILPMVEMAGQHSKFIPEILYVYNRENPISDDRTNRAFQIELDNNVRARKQYQPLKAI